MIEEIVYNDYIYKNYNTKLNDDSLELLYK